MNGGNRVVSPRLRYAPSPTGDPHVGNIRTALWSWLHARRHGGAFVVRVEDTDQSRAVPGAEERILESLRWLGLDWDEGPGVDGPHAPYVQSQRLSLYRQEVDRLLEAGSAYRCFDTPEQLAAHAERLLDDDALARRLSANAQALARERFTPQAFANGFTAAIAAAHNAWRARPT